MPENTGLYASYVSENTGLSVSLSLSDTKGWYDLCGLPFGSGERICKVAEPTFLSFFTVNHVRLLFTTSEKAIWQCDTQNHGERSDLQPWQRKLLPVRVAVCIGCV